MLAMLSQMSYTLNGASLSHPLSSFASLNNKMNLTTDNMDGGGVGGAAGGGFTGLSGHPVNSKMVSVCVYRLSPSSHCFIHSQSGAIGTIERGPR